MVQSGAALGAPTRRRREGRTRWLLVILVGLAVLTCGWTALWFYSTSRAGRVVDAVIAREARNKRIWACPDRQFRGYPLTIMLACREPSFVGELRGRLVKAHAMALRASVSLTDPNRVVVAVDGPLRIEIGGDADVTADWSSFQVNVKGPLGFDRAAIEIERPKVTVDMPYSGTASGAAVRASLRVRQLAPRMPLHADDQIVLAVSGLTSDLLDENFGSSGPADMDASVVVGDVGTASGRTVPEWLDSWRRGGGRLSINAATLSKGPTKIELGGALSLDDAHRLAGDLAVGLTNVDGLASHLHLPANAAGIGKILGALLGGAAKTSAGDGAKAAAMTITLALSGGRVYWGMLPLPVLLRPLY